MFLLFVIEKLYTQLHDPEHELVMIGYVNLHSLVYWDDAGAFYIFFAFLVAREIQFPAKIGYHGNQNQNLR